LGSIDNKGTKSKGLVCADMDNILSVADCKKIVGDDAVIPDDGTAVCITSNSDKNVCPGDYGGKFFFIFLLKKIVLFKSSN
jgi:hypothetical protein